MTYEDTLAVLSILKAAYPNFYRGMTKQDAEGVVNLWYDMFKAEPGSLVIAAVKTLLETDDKGFPPHIGAVKEKLRMLTQKEEMTEMEAWGLVSRALKNGLYGYREEWERLPETVRSAIGAPEQLRDWAMMDVDTVNSVVSSNFQRAYRAKAKREREVAALPAEVRAMLREASGVIALNGGNGV